ncbi:M28 family peptidase [Acinetobacter baumannii]|nr:M28 family peptidase [Acinetobacter baumannii]
MSTWVFMPCSLYLISRTCKQVFGANARSLQPQKEQIKAVFILDMIGYFYLKNVQDYPPGLKWIYSSHGNFIATLSNFESRELGSACCEAMKRLNQLDCQRIVAPSFLAGVDFSDHFNYWQLGLPAVLITDIAFYRNKAYHSADDRIDRLNTIKMTQTLNGLVYTLLNNAF